MMWQKIKEQHGKHIKMELKVSRDLKDGLSGIMRLKNEAIFISDCIDSVIDALDELIIVYNDCTDETPVIVEQKRKQYPTKIRVYPYEHHLYSYNLSRSEYDYAMSLPEDSPFLFCNQCNYAFSKVRYKYAMLVDVDQLYFVDCVKQWRDICVKEVKFNGVRLAIGWFFLNYVSLYRQLSSFFRKPCLWMLSPKLVKWASNSYVSFVQRGLKKGKIAVALSGCNVFKDDLWYVPFDGENINPPYNGEGDHLIFRVTSDTYFYRRGVECTKVQNYAVSHSFHCPYKLAFVGLAWFHLHANRDRCWSRVKRTKDIHPNWFVPIEDFPEMSYKVVHDKMDKNVHSLYQRILFALVHILSRDLIKKHLYLLR